MFRLFEKISKNKIQLNYYLSYYSTKLLFLGQIDYEELKKHGSESIGPSLKAPWP